MINKSIFAVLILSFCANFSYAQNFEDEGRYEFGLRIAPQVSWSSPDTKNLTDGGISLDWNYGFHVSKKFTSRYSVAFEINVINMTSKIKYTDNLTIFSPENPLGAVTKDYSINYDLRYLQVPLVFKMATDKFKEKWSLYGEFGASLSFLLRSKANINSSVYKRSEVDIDNPNDEDKFYINQNKQNDDYSQKVNFFRPSFIIGGGVNYDLMGNTKLFTGLRYDGGLVDYLDANKWTANNSFTGLNIGIIF